MVKFGASKWNTESLSRLSFRARQHFFLHRGRILILRIDCGHQNTSLVEFLSVEECTRLKRTVRKTRAVHAHRYMCHHSTNAIQIANAWTISYSFCNKYKAQILYSRSFRYHENPTDSRYSCTRVTRHIRPRFRCGYDNVQPLKMTIALRRLSAAVFSSGFVAFATWAWPSGR